MEPEIELERFAALCAEVEAGTPLERVLQAEGLSAEAWSQSRDTWMERMSHEPTAERNALEARYKAAFDGRKRAIALRAKAADGEASGVDDAPTPPRGQSMAIGLMDTVPMLPSADPEQLLARLRARRAQAQGQGKEGGAAPSEPPSPLPARGEQTPPMRPRSALVSDGTAKAASDAMAGARPPPPPAGMGKPALPFQPPAPLPPPPPAPSRPSGARPAPAFPPPPPPAPAGGFAKPPAMPMGGYPAVPPPSPSSPGGRSTPVPGTVPAAAPMSLGGFSSVASGPRLSLERYAAFAAEVAVHPVQLTEIRAKYGLNDSAHTTEDEAWQRRFSADRETYVRYATLFQHYRDWFSARGPR